MDENKLLDAIKAMFESQTAELAAIKATVNNQSAELASIKSMMDGQTAELKQEISRIDKKIDTLGDKMDKGFAATRSEVVDAVEAVGNKVDALKGKVTDVETVTARNAFELQLIKGRA